MGSLFSKIKKKMKTIISSQEKVQPEAMEVIPEEEIYKILLLTNRDSDNVGDQVIEASDIALIKAAMKNLGVDEKHYRINSRAASIVPKKYMETRNDAFLEGAEKTISECDMVIFGGAPLFNYLYQVFYERTAVTLEIAQKYNKPVIFSAIGIERYDEENEKCQRLKKTLNFDCVKQITTRDGIEELTKYKENPNMVIDRVADPAVFSAPAFKNHISDKQGKKKKKVGIFVFRANGFVDNKIDFTREDAAKLWMDTIAELESKGYSYSLLTSGNFGDEAFLDYMIRVHGISEKKCVFNMNTPEKLVEKISSYDAIISCRLHPSIISFSLGVPSVGIIWNSKVKHFYECVGYGDRSIGVDGINAQSLVEKVEEAMEAGVTKDTEYLMTVYRYIFSGIKNSLGFAEDIQPYDYDALLENIPPCEDTSKKEYEIKLKRKFRRTYDTANKRLDDITNLKNKIKELEEKQQSYKLYYHSSDKGEQVVAAENWNDGLDGEMHRLESGAMECVLNQIVKNDGLTCFKNPLFENEGKEFSNWRMRFRIGSMWFWYIEDDLYCSKDAYSPKASKKVKKFMPGEAIPRITLSGVESVVVEAQWKEKEEAKEE